jgi:type II secretory pathway component PulM
MPVNTDLLALFVAAVVFVCGMAGLYLHAWRPEQEGVDETRDLVNRMTGLIATMSALVLGLLVASANNFYNTQKAGLETVSARILQLDSLLRRYGPDAQPARDILKDMVTDSYESVWESGSRNLRMPTIEQTAASMDAMFNILNRLRETAPVERQYRLAKAAEITASINDQRLQMALQVSNSLSWPFMTILVSWAGLLFFGFGMLSRVNRTTVAGLAVGAVAVASAIFLIVELSIPYSGLLRLSPEPVLRTIEALGK